jgi:hypothetical protein
MAEMNFAYIAHIIADSPNGPRGDPTLSPQLSSSLSNLMLLCDVHHRLVDRDDVAGHPADRLRNMKERHETRVELLTSLQEERKSHVILYGSNIGNHRAQVSAPAAFQAMVPDRYPADTLTLRLGLGNSPFTDAEDIAWMIEQESLARQFAEQVKPRLAGGDGHHFSVFALAPQPLLMQLGYLLCDINYETQIYQLHREPPGWSWQEHPDGFGYIVEEPAEAKGPPALVLALSATVTDDRIFSVIGKDAAIWRVTIREPGNDFLKSPRQLQQFRQTIRPLMDRIKARHGQGSLLHVFPAAPVSVAVELGRIIMPKADMPLRIYDQNNDRGGFVHALDINPAQRGAS